MDTNINILTVNYDYDSVTITGKFIKTLETFIATVTKKSIDDIKELKTHEGIAVSISDGVAYVIEVDLAPGIVELFPELDLPKPKAIHKPIPLKELGDKNVMTDNKYYLGLPTTVFMHLLGQITTIL